MRMIEMVRIIRKNLKHPKFLNNSNRRNLGSEKFIQINLTIPAIFNFFNSRYF